jgi:hypothetical protein
MSVLRRLYNVAYGKVRSWQSGDRIDAELEGELRSVRERPVGLRERWAPPGFTDGAEQDELEGADSVEAEDAAPRVRRL